MGKIAIFGGTFDPVHWGHLSMAEKAVSQFGLDKVIWVPDPSPPHKSRRVLANLVQRREMVRRAIADRPDFVLSPQQDDPTGTSYAIETFLYLQNTYSDTHWYWIIGSDAFQTLPQWHRCQEIGKLCYWLVAPRPFQEEGESGDRQGTQFDPRDVVEQMAVLGVQIRCGVLEMPWNGISSSLIRQYCLEERDLYYLVPETVRTYITALKLYQARPQT
ncbi:nicotinate (nicotinamide) nucleotide adenylyltransferase [Kamptonema sp. UHCC 0994]|uniref:nicotinate (nicotinamide) nucleotide adenylyltransferase n=1 Tax=Kamptonema sp. UHCC 0994 TaxID=3031329 RepID=UPI0023B9CE3D|nr:nicotinate (nicotinamide) nucleotide adenylyltransferase [Kamptonema sp. UHCC 0994]MDF0552281.1 nicotinate (nicotinamide) nucleotide adenylyltransferase [Kamptonema sp. UHCC 0994]